MLIGDPAPGDRPASPAVLRHLLTRFTMGKTEHPADAQIFRRHLDRFQVKAVVLKRSELTPPVKGG